MFRRLNFSPRCLRVVLLLALVTPLITGCGGSKENKVLRIGYQKWGTFSILKVSGQLEKELAPRGVSVDWIEFAAGPPLLEALNAGSIDIGHTGDSPPIFAQAAGVPFVYVAVTPPSPEGSGLLAPNNGSVKTPADLKGKRIGFSKGTSAHTFVVRLLESQGLGLSDVETVYLSPADARAALDSGSIDAWAIWDPFLAAAETSGLALKVADGRGLVAGREFYLASRPWLETAPELANIVLAALKRVGGWADEEQAKVRDLLVKETGISEAAISLAESRRERYALVPITDDVIAEQQSLADRYQNLGLLPQKLNVSDVVYRKPLEALQ